jgi:hypothetical protein
MTIHNSGPSPPGLTKILSSGYLIKEPDHQLTQLIIKILSMNVSFLYQLAGKPTAVFILETPFRCFQHARYIGKEQQQQQQQ